MKLPVGEGSDATSRLLTSKAICSSARCEAGRAREVRGGERGWGERGVVLSFMEGRGLRWERGVPVNVPVGVDVRQPNGVSGLDTVPTTGDMAKRPGVSDALHGNAAAAGLLLLSQLSFAGLEADCLFLLT